MCIAATASGKGNTLLLVEIAIHALVALYFHMQNHFLTSDRKTYKITETIPVLHKMTLTAIRTCLYPPFCLDIKNYSITFVFLTSAFKGVKTPSMI